MVALDISAELAVRTVLLLLEKLDRMYIKDAISTKHMITFTVNLSRRD